MQTVPAQHLDSLEDIDHSEDSNYDYRPAPYLPSNSDNDSVTAASMAEQFPPNHRNYTDSSRRAGHQSSSHHTGSNSREGVAGDTVTGHHCSSATAAATSTDIMQNSGDRGDPSTSYALHPSAAQDVYLCRPERQTSTTSPNSASQEHFRESGLTRELDAPSREALEEAPSSYTSQSRSQGQVNALSATSLQDTPPTPQGQVTFTPTANRMHTNEQVLNQQV